ncbi:hypothetical protein E1301_Tti008073 [Triplophysa tibetana]|uniref:Uncharacterized protein n=1 Tax=Triplophysa tibetana TaxID=1572043 RepID=A0A5A9NGZ8_9TELE|nr:hypothetical protein E1301_Tti008073 [Triplophysa tibetana]
MILDLGPVDSALSGLAGEDRKEAEVIIIFCPGSSEKHDHRPGSSTDSIEKPLIEDAVEKSKPGRERRWNMVRENETSSQTVNISHSALPWKFGAGPVNTLSELHLVVTWRGGPVMCSADRDGCYGPPTDCKDKGTRRHANEDRKLVQTCITALCNTIIIRRELNLRLR